MSDKNKNRPRSIRLAITLLLITTIVATVTGNVLQAKVSSLQILWRERTGIQLEQNTKRPARDTDQLTNMNEASLSPQQLKRRLDMKKREVAQRIIVEIAQEEVIRLQGRNEELFHASASHRPLHSWRWMWAMVDEVARWFNLSAQV